MQGWNWRMIFFSLFHSYTYIVMIWNGFSRGTFNYRLTNLKDIYSIIQCYFWQITSIFKEKIWWMFFLNQIKNCKVNFLLVERYTKVSSDGYPSYVPWKRWNLYSLDAGNEVASTFFTAKSFRGEELEKRAFFKRPRVSLTMIAFLR